MKRELTVRNEQNWFQSLRNRIGDVVSRWFQRRDDGQANQMADPGETYPSSLHRALAIPSVDVVDEGDSIRVVADLPGMTPDEFTVEADSRRFFIRGERTARRNGQRGGYSFAEWRHGAFARTIPLPCEVEPARSEARYRNGTLETRLPKTEAARARPVQVAVTLPKLQTGEGV